MPPAGAHAKELLRFKAPTQDNLGISSHIYLQAFAKEVLHTPLDRTFVSKVDLNGDGLNEFILKYQSCSNKKRCTYYILGEARDNIVELGRIEAKYITINARIKNGSRTLAVYNDASNDYTFKEYAWMPLQKRYVAATATEK